MKKRLPDHRGGNEPNVKSRRQRKHAARLLKKKLKWMQRMAAGESS